MLCKIAPSGNLSGQSDDNGWTRKSSGFEKYSAFLYNETRSFGAECSPGYPVYTSNTGMSQAARFCVIILMPCFQNIPFLVAFGEDVGKIGGVNQAYEGLQKKYGEHRIFDTGIRETSIIGKGIGLALRGFRPIAEIQYFDYLLYALQILSDDLATTHWRTAGGQSYRLSSAPGDTGLKASGIPDRH